MDFLKTIHIPTLIAAVVITIVVLMVIRK